MKFSAALLLLAPLFVSQVAAMPAGGRGGFGGNRGGNNGGHTGAASSSVVSTSTAAAASASAPASTNNAANGGGNNGNNNNGNTGNATATSGGDLQSSTTLDQSVIATGFAQNGQETPEAGQVASLTSTNNFINFCVGQTITNGQQITTGSCNPAPMGQIPSTSNMPSCKFVNPKNGDTIAANTAFTITMAIQKMETGNFVNAAANYFAAPQQLNSAGQVIGHSHVVVEQLTDLAQTTPLDVTKFAFFKGLNDAAVNGQLTADVTAGLPAGVYKLSSINTAANHQPVLVPIAQHGSVDDVVYFTVSDNGAAAGGASNSTAAASTTAAAASSTTAAAGGNGGNNGNANNGSGRQGGRNRGRYFLREWF